MKSIFKEKLLQYVITKKSNAGFTVLELLVVIIIIGILAAIALPSFLSCGAKAKSSEARSNISAIARAQQAYYYENNKFANTVAELKISIPQQTENYSYSIQNQGNIFYSYGTARNDNLKSFASVVLAKGNHNTFVKNCQSDLPTNKKISAPIIIKGNLVCAPNTLEMN